MCLQVEWGTCAFYVVYVSRLKHELFIYASAYTNAEDYVFNAYLTEEM